MQQDHIEKHSTVQSIILHLFPGILVVCFYLLARQPVANLGYPSVVALILAFAFFLIPAELGYLFYQGKKIRGDLHYKGSSAIGRQSHGGNTWFGSPLFLLQLEPYFPG